METEKKMLKYELLTVNTNSWYPIPETVIIYAEDYEAAVCVCNVVLIKMVDINNSDSRLDIDDQALLN